jgi:cytochrome c oxidase cbb3-type subunit 1
LSGRSAGGKTNPALRFFVFGVAAFVTAGLMNAAGAAPGVIRVTSFTWFGPAQTQLQVFGFFAMTMFGAVYYILPRVTGVGFPFAGAVRAHFWCAALGILLLALPLAVGGVVQGWKLNDATVPFMDVVKSTLPFLRVSTLGDAAITLGNALFLLNLLALLFRYCRVQVAAAYATATADLELAEAAS